MNEAKAVMVEFNQTRCEPQWSDREIEHKITSALNQSIQEGWFNSEDAAPLSGFTAVSGFPLLEDMPDADERGLKRTTGVGLFRAFPSPICDHSGQVQPKRAELAEFTLAQHLTTR